ncbi:MAG: hypothetical protein HUN04_20050 [Desulfobacter sp.]|nr:MAG: hypothetical protein HUN04_20050 [Desulfobacter sp.]
MKKLITGAAVLVFTALPVWAAEIFNAMDVKEDMLQFREFVHKTSDIPAADRYEFDQQMLKMARTQNEGRDEILAKIFKKAGIQPLKQTGTPSTSKYSQGIFGDADFETISKKNFDKILKAARDLGYTIVPGGGGSATIKELDSTFFHDTPKGYKSRAAFQDPEMMTSFKLKKGELGMKKAYSITLSDNMKKMHGSLDVDPETLLKKNKVQELAKSTMRIQDAMDQFKSPGIKKDRTIKELFQAHDDFYKTPANRGKRLSDLTFKEKLTMVKAGVSLETAGVVQPGASAQERIRQVEAFQNECKKIVDKGLAERLKAETDVDSMLKKQYAKSIESGNYKKAAGIRQEMMENGAMRNYADEGIHGEGNRKLIAEHEGFEVKKIKNAGTGKTYDVYQPVNQEVPDRFKKGGVKGALNQKQFDAYVRQKRVKKLIDIQKFGKTDTLSRVVKLTGPKAVTSKNVKLTQADVDKYMAKKKFKLTGMNIAGGIINAYEIYEAQKRSQEDIVQEITADTTDLELAGKTVKHLAKTFYYTTPLAGLADVSQQEYKKAAREYEEALANGEDPSLAWAVAKGTAKTVGQFSWGMVKAVTVKPKDDIIALAKGSVGTLSDWKSQYDAQSTSTEMTARVKDYKNRMFAQKAQLEKTLGKMKATPGTGKKVDWEKMSSEYVMTHTVAYLEHRMRMAEKAYKEALKQSKGVKTTAVAQAFKRVAGYVETINRSLADPEYGKMVAQREQHIHALEIVRARLAALSKGTRAASPKTVSSIDPQIIAGQWSTTWGDMTIRVKGKQVTGTYDYQGGRIFGVVKGRSLSGKWVENRTKVKCASSVDGSSHWGFFQFELVGDHLEGSWEYCEPKEAGGVWNGTRKDTKNGS